ncbi:PREDICTED: uncharacterized protein LOC109244869 [Nicotiana attenuata]|uniref:uncharacterized protein LOC109244869 n=1 Tax=Nicotiana attenuata TaxID=49451 RepID=UPI000904D0BD|nr:PREDICTED: uncharacterized protein LOC109244869 [Nicotiana attenuata]
MEAAIRVVRYVKQEPGLGIFLSTAGSDKLTAYCDADWVSCPNTRRFVTGYSVKFGDSLISWNSKKQTTISHSSAEADKSTIQIAANLGFHECTKHIDINYHFIREKVQQGLVSTLYLSSAEQQADMLTKGLTKAQHSYLVSNLGMKSSFLLA